MVAATKGSSPRRRAGRAAHPPLLPLSCFQGMLPKHRPVYLLQAKAEGWRINKQKATRRNVPVDSGMEKIQRNVKGFSNIYAVEDRKQLILLILDLFYAMNEVLCYRCYVAMKCCATCSM